MTLTTHQKMLAIQSLGDAVVRAWPEPHTAWSIRPGFDVGGDGILDSAVHWGDTPEAAIDACWNRIEHLPKDRHLVISQNGLRKRIRWNGFMFETVEVSK